MVCGPRERAAANPRGGAAQGGSDAARSCVRWAAIQNALISKRAVFDRTLIRGPQEERVRKPSFHWYESFFRRALRGDVCSIRATGACDSPSNALAVATPSGGD
jgi:hypothetical protein